MERNQNQKGPRARFSFARKGVGPLFACFRGRVVETGGTGLVLMRGEIKNS